MAVVISLADFERYQRLARERFFQVVDRVQPHNDARNPDEVLRDVSEAVNEARQKAHGSGA